MNENSTRMRLSLLIAHRVLEMLDSTNASDEDKKTAIDVARQVLSTGTCVAIPFVSNSASPEGE